MTTDGVTAGDAERRAGSDAPEHAHQRRLVVDAAEAIVRDRGVGALRLDDVADAVGLHRSTVYRYVDSKEALVTAVVVQATLRLGRTVIDRLGPDATPRRFLGEGLAIALAEMAADPVHRSLMAPSASTWIARVGAMALTEGMRPLIEPVFADADERGILRAGVTPDDAIRWLQIVAMGLVRTPDIAPDPDELVRLLNLMLVPALLDEP